MAKLPSLVSAFPQVDGRERATIEHVARYIRERGYITTGKRGNGAADMTPHEAANLLIALNCADAPKDAPTEIDRFRSLRQWYVVGRGTMANEQLERYDSYPLPIRDVFDTHTFGEGLDALIEGVPDLVASLQQYAVEAYGEDEGLMWMRTSLGATMFGVQITFRKYAPKIELFTTNGSERRVEFEVNYQVDNYRFRDGFYGRNRPDRVVSVSVGTRTLVAIWNGLNPERALDVFGLGPSGDELDK